jgi:hypothetical protein
MVDSQISKTIRIGKFELWEFINYAKKSKYGLGLLTMAKVGHSMKMHWKK